MQNKSRTMLHASLLVALSGILYGFLGYLGTGLLREDMSICTMLFWRFLIAGIWISLFIFKGSSIAEVLHGVNKQYLILMFFLGAIGYAGSSAFYFIASQYTGTGLAMVIFFSYPIIVACTAWFAERHNFKMSIFLTLIAMSLGLFLLQDFTNKEMNLYGIFFGVIAAVCYAFYVLGSKRMTAKAIHSNLLTTVVCFGCAFIFLIYSLIAHELTFPITLKSWLYLVAISIFATALPIQLMLEGLKYVSSLRASIISVLEPLVTMLVGVILLEESISNLQMLGALIILGGALFVQFQRGL